VTLQYGDMLRVRDPEIIEVGPLVFNIEYGISHETLQYKMNTRRPHRKGEGAGKLAPPSEQSPAGLPYKNFRNGKPEYNAIQVHYTVTFNAKDAISVLAKRGFSYHYIIDKDGTVTMTVDPAKAVAIHAGKGGPPGGHHARIGISFVNLGNDSQHAGGGWGGRSAPPLDQWEAFSPHEDRWEPYTTAQIDAGKRLVSRLVKQFPDVKTIYGHEDTKAAKHDPGPAFDKYWGEFEALLPDGRGNVARTLRKRHQDTATT